MLVDWEIHTVAHRGQDERMTIARIVTRCAELSLTHIGIIDHLAPERGWPAEALKKVFADFEDLQVPSGLHVYRGAEVDITEAGYMPQLQEVRKELALDYVIGSVHEGRKEGATDEEYVSRQFELMMRVLQERSPIDIVGHPWGGRSLEKVPEDMLRGLLRRAAALGVGVEVSAVFGAGEADLELLIRWALEEGTKLAPASDAHDYDHLGETAKLQPVLEEAGARSGDLWLPTHP